MEATILYPILTWETLFSYKKNYYSIIYIDNEGRHVRMLQYYKIIDLTCSPFFLCRCMRDVT